MLLLSLLFTISTLASRQSFVVEFFSFHPSGSISRTTRFELRAESSNLFASVDTFSPLRFIAQISSSVMRSLNMAGHFAGY